MGRLFRGFLAIKSLVVGILILALWARSYFVGDLFHKGNQSQYIEIASGCGDVIVSFGHDGGPTKLVGSWKRVRTDEPRELIADNGMARSAANAIGFGYSKTFVGDPPTGVLVHIMLPHWLMFLLAIPSLLRWLWRRSMKHAGPIAAGRSWCPRCVREIRGVVANCPGCGGPVASEPAAFPRLEVFER